MDLAKLKSVSAEPQTSSSGQPRLLQAALNSTPGSDLGSGIPTLEHLREKKKPGSTLPNNFVFSSKGTLTYETLDLPDFVNGFLEFQKQQPDECKPGLTQHLQLLMARASTYQWSSVAFTCRLPQQSIRADFRGLTAMRFVRDNKHFSRTKTYARNHTRRARNKIKARSSHSSIDLIATRKRNIAVIGIIPPNVVATLPAQAIPATTGFACVTRRITPRYIVPRGNSLSRAHRLTRIRLGNDKHS